MARDETSGLSTDRAKRGKEAKLREFDGFDRRGEANGQIDQDRASKGHRGLHRKGGERDRG
jgi:hypothetical protein